MAKAKKRRGEAKTSKMGMVLKVGVFCFVAYLAVSLVTTQVKIASRKSELEELNQAIAELQSQNEETTKLLGSENEDEFIERIAREKLGYAAPGERVYADAAGN